MNSDHCQQRSISLCYICFSHKSHILRKKPTGYRVDPAAIDRVADISIYKSRRAVKQMIAQRSNIIALVLLLLASQTSVLFCFRLGTPMRQALISNQALRMGPEDSSIVGVFPDGGVSPCVIKVVGVGGAGGNAVLRMIQTGVDGVEFAAVNTDAQALSRFEGIAETLNIGREVTRGLGAGGIPDNGRKAAEESRNEIQNLVSNTDLVFVTAGMGGGTGSGAAPIVADIARKAGALTVGVVTKPFGFEGRRRMQQAVAAIENLRGVVDTLIIVANDRLLQIIPENTPLERAFTVADDVLRQGVVGISEIIIRPGLINVDFADVRTIMGDAGTALMGIGRGSGRDRAEEAAEAAIASPLLDFPIERARGVVFNIVGGTDLTLQEINAAAEVIYEAVDPNANIIFGALVDSSMDGEVAITVIATGFPLAASELAGAAGVASDTTVGAAVKKAAQQVEDQATVLRRQLKKRSNERKTADSLQKQGAIEEEEEEEEDDDVPDFISRLRRKR